MTVFEVVQGASPVILAMPHTGTFVPADVLNRLNANGRLLSDTDWHVDRLYDGLLPCATTVRASFHRYVVDANRDPAGNSLYPGQNTTGLIPLTDFSERPLWIEGQEPGEAEAAERVARFHAPYHAALRAEIDRVRGLHGIAVLYDCHSIQPVLPFLFPGRLPDFSIGSFDGRSCASAITEAVRAVCASANDYTHVVDGRFKGGWTTRHYGRPEEGVHAIQMELAQSTHLAGAAAPFAYDEGGAERIRPVLRTILAEVERLALRLAPGAA